MPQLRNALLDFYEACSEEIIIADNKKTQDVHNADREHRGEAYEKSELNQESGDIQESDIVVHGQDFIPDNDKGLRQKLSQSDQKNDADTGKNKNLPIVIALCTLFSEMKSSSTETKIINPHHFIGVVIEENNTIFSYDDMGDASIFLRFLIKHILLEIKSYEERNSSSGGVSTENTRKNIQTSADRVIKCLVGSFHKCIRGTVIQEQENDSDTEDVDELTTIRNNWYDDDLLKVTFTKEFSTPILISMNNHNNNTANSSNLFSSLGNLFDTDNIIHGYKWKNLNENDQIIGNTETKMKTKLFCGEQLQQLPPYLLPHYIQFQIERFDFRRARKLLDEFDIPFFINLASYVYKEGDDEGEKEEFPNHCMTYYLNGIIYHQGTTLDDGHYFAIIRQQDVEIKSKHNNSNSDDNNEWVVYNDESVSQLPLPLSLSSKPYFPSSKTLSRLYPDFFTAPPNTKTQQSNQNQRNVNDEFHPMVLIYERCTRKRQSITKKYSMDSWEACCTCCKSLEIQKKLIRQKELMEKYRGCLSSSSSNNSTSSSSTSSDEDSTTSSDSDSSSSVSSSSGTSTSSSLSNEKLIQHEEFIQKQKHQGLLTTSSSSGSSSDEESTSSSSSS